MGQTKVGCRMLHTAIVVAVVLALSGCAPMGTYEAEVCRSWSTQWDWACPRDYIRVAMDE